MVGLEVSGSSGNLARRGFTLLAAGQCGHDATNFVFSDFRHRGSITRLTHQRKRNAPRVKDLTEYARMSGGMGREEICFSIGLFSLQINRLLRSIASFFFVYTRNSFKPHSILAG